MAPRTSAGWRALVVAGLAVLAVVLLAPGAGPPLYDGIGFPDDPYRWVQPPAGAAKTPAVTPASVTLTPSADGTVPGAQGLSAEKGPQIAFAVADGALTVPAGTRRVTLKAEAAANPATSPAAGTLVSHL